jgi:Cu-Zn family superoxide dismutase
MIGLHRMSAVAVFTGIVEGEVLCKDTPTGCRLTATFTKLPVSPGRMHGFHIHKAGDLRGEGCKGACEHFHMDPAGSQGVHGGPPGSRGPRHTGDLGNIEGPTWSKQYFLRGVHVADLYGRSMIVHADEDDLGLGGFEDSATTGHSGARIACAIIGRASCAGTNQSRKNHT